MASFDQKGALNDVLGQHPSKNIPVALSWEQMGPRIQAELAAKKKRRSFFIFWLLLGVFTITAFYYLLAAPWSPKITCFPVAVGQELTDEIPKRLEREPASDERTMKSDKYLTTTAMDLPSVTRKGSADLSEKNTAVPAFPLGNAGMPAKEAKSTILPELSDKTTGNAVAFSTATNTAEMRISGSAKTSSDPVLNITTLPVDPLVKAVTTEVQDIVAKWTEVPAASENQLAISSWQIEAGMGVNSYRSSASNTSASVSPGNPQALNGFTGSLLVGCPIGSGVYSFWTGFSYQELVQKERFENEFGLQLYQPNTLDTIYRNLLTGEETLVYTDSVAGVRRIYIQQHNFFRTYAIPLTLRRQWDQQKWPLALQMGIDVNWSQWKKGKTLAADAQLAATNTDASLGLGVRLGAQLYSPRTRFGRLFVGLSYQRSWQEYSGTLTGTSFRPASINLMMGVRLEN